MLRTLLRFFDKLEDSIRISLSHYPIAYSLIGGVGIVLFWRGTWMLADELHLTSIDSIIASIILLLSTGLFVSVFIGDNIIMTGLRREKKLVERTEEEVIDESFRLTKMEKKLDTLEKLLRKQLKESKARTQESSDQKKSEQEV